ncbi:LCP family protein [Phormidium sp. LEGE 05292]|uniref:LCP family protein n=1 Tax=[Phormidium] sp. LEGE 05292 TaxID=767427 RepID=UPI00188067D4|nr:LCP family protein [Phormidium sp. LEGE 05292]MBE9225101.1 LCP family protein [Phormidium sp. LEGE 05292]
MLDTAEPIKHGSESQSGNFPSETEKTSPVQQWQSLKTSVVKRIQSAAKNKSLFWGLAFGVTATVATSLGITLGIFAPLPFVASEQQTQSLSDILQKFAVYKMTRPVNILVMGVDRVPDAPKDSPAGLNGRSDTLLLLRLDPSDNSVKMLSIPRDTHVDNPFLSINKINQANVDGGAALAADVVSSTLDGVKIDRYVRVTTEAFRKLVDLVGGVEVFVPKKMHYKDETQHLEINLEPGLQTLNGEQAEQFARFRQDENGDIGRVQRQQLLLQAVRQRLTNPNILPRLPEMMSVMKNYVDTNINWEEMLALANFGLNLQKTDIKMVMLPGRFSHTGEFDGRSYWVVDEEKRDRLMQQYFGVEVKEIAKETENDSTTSVRIAIQNASGQSNMSNRAAQYLRKLGFRNIYLVRDWPETQTKTQIIVQKGDVKAAEKLQSALGMGTIEPASVGDIESDLTLRVGEDWIPSTAANF